MNTQYVTEMKQILTNCIINNEFYSKTLFCFGYNEYTEDIIEYLLFYNIKLEAILDNSPNKLNMNYMHIFVIKPSSILKYKTDDCVVLIASSFYNEMVIQLHDIGYKGKIVKTINFIPYHKKTLIISYYNTEKEKLLKGLKSLQKIKLSFPNTFFIIQHINGGMGDVYWSLAYLPAYLKGLKQKEYAVIIAGNAALQTAKLFTDNVILLDNDEIHNLAKAVIFLHDNNFLFTFPSIIMDTDMSVNHAFKYFSLERIFKATMYGFGNKIESNPPSRLSIFNENIKMKKNKTIIMAPYANSVKKAPTHFWRKLADKYINEQYMVCTNISESELPIENTIPLKIPINQIKSAVEYAGNFIGIRSGLCDIIHNAKCKKTVVFREDDILNHVDIKRSDFCPLVNWDTLLVNSVGDIVSHIK